MQRVRERLFFSLTFYIQMFRRFPSQQYRLIDTTRDATILLWFTPTNSNMLHQLFTNVLSKKKKKNLFTNVKVGLAMHNHSLQSDEGTGKPKSKSKSHHASLITLEPPNLSPLETPPKLEKNFSFLGH